MVRSLVAALSSFSDSAVANGTVHNTVGSDVVGPRTDAPHQVEQSLLVRIGQEMYYCMILLPVTLVFYL